MSKQPLLVLDTHYLCHRAFHTTGGLSHNGNGTGIIFGFLKSIAMLKDEFSTDRIAFCFEHPHLLRRDIYPEYKLKRRLENKNPEEIKAFQNLYKQIKLLRTEYLPRIGFKNVFCQDGYEADDIMAGIALNESALGEEVILITSDADLLQCLNDTVTIYSPQARKHWTQENFQSLYDILPQQWALVKAIAGCGGDCVAGIPGVGEISALKYVRKTLKSDSAAYKKIMSKEGKAIVRRNRKLVQLPYEHFVFPTIQSDEIDLKEWKEVCAELGFKSLAGQPPVHIRQMKLL